MAINNQYQKIVPFIIFVLALVLLFLLVRPMIVILLSGVLLAYVAFPVYKRIFGKIHRKSLSILLALLLIILIALIPLSFLVVEITQQGVYFYNSLSSHISKGALLGFGCTSSESEVCLLLNQAESFSLKQLSKFGLDKQLEKFLPILEDKISGFILTIPLIIAAIFLTIVISYYLLQDWENFLQDIIDFLPMRKKTSNKLITDFGNITHTVIYAQLFVALIIGIVASIGFYIFGVPFPMILGIILGFFTLIPTAGTSIIWIPVSLYMILSGYFSNDQWILWKGLGLFFYCLIIVNYIDNFLLIKIVQAKANVSQIIVIIGVIGGVAMFGIMGIFIGPILLPLLLTYVKMFKGRFA